MMSFFNRILQTSDNIIWFLMAHNTYPDCLFIKLWQPPSTSLALEVDPSWMDIKATSSSMQAPGLVMCYIYSQVNLFYRKGIYLSLLQVNGIQNRPVKSVQLCWTGQLKKFVQYIFKCTSVQCDSITCNFTDHFRRSSFEWKTSQSNVPYLK